VRNNEVRPLETFVVASALKGKYDFDFSLKRKIFHEGAADTNVYPASRQSVRKPLAVMAN
jgi:hypothetical protein